MCDFSTDLLLTKWGKNKTSLVFSNNLSTTRSKEAYTGFIHSISRAVVVMYLLSVVSCVTNKCKHTAEEGLQGRLCSRVTGVRWPCLGYKSITFHSGDASAFWTDVPNKLMLMGVYSHKNI